MSAQYKLPFFYDYVLPNTVMPNALPPEMGVVNYIHTLYSNRLSTESFFDEDLDSPQSPMRRMFGDQLGHMPSSIYQNGTHLCSPCFTNVVKIYKDSIYFGKRRGQNRYIYPIKVTLHFERFTGVDHVGSKLNGEFFWKHISAEALQDIKSGKALVFLDWGNESFIDRQTLVDFHYGIKYSGIPKHQIVLAINSFNAKEVYESWFTPEERCMEVMNFPFLLSVISWSYNTHLEHVTFDEFFQSEHAHRKNHFVLPIRRSRGHRLSVLYKLASDNLLDKGDWSCLEATPWDYGLSRASSYPLGFDTDKVRQLHEQIPKNLDDEPTTNFDNAMGWTNTAKDPYKNSYLYIASETYTHGPYKSLTEKVFKPLGNFQPFVFLAFPGALGTLRSLGFKTFSPFIDESYDDEPDQARRIQMIYSEIKRIASMSKEEIHNWYWSMKDILCHNHSHLLDIYKNEKHTQELVHYLHERTKY